MSAKRQPREAYVGIDVAKRKRLPVCILVREGGRVRPLRLRGAGLPKPPAGRGNRAALDRDVVRAFASETRDYLQAIEAEHRLRIRGVALDCPRAPATGTERRAAERAMAARRISCFATPSARQWKAIRALARGHLSGGGPENRLRHANQLWMLVGFELFATLAAHWACREVFPHAIVAALGVNAGHKSSAAGYAAQLAAAAQATKLSVADLTAELRQTGYGSRHDRLDAYLCAWVASLLESQLEACGSPPDDVIWVPRRSARSALARGGASEVRG